MRMCKIILGPGAVQRADNIVQWINHYPADKMFSNQILYPLDSHALIYWIKSSALCTTGAFDAYGRFTTYTVTSCRNGKW